MKKLFLLVSTIFLATGISATLMLIGGAINALLVKAFGITVRIPSSFVDGYVLPAFSFCLTMAAITSLPVVCNLVVRSLRENPSRKGQNIVVILYLSAAAIAIPAVLFAKNYDATWIVTLILFISLVFGYGGRRYPFIFETNYWKARFGS